jgi:hypothetical protein
VCQWRQSYLGVDYYEQALAGNTEALKLATKKFQSATNVICKLIELGQVRRRFSSSPSLSSCPLLFLPHTEMHVRRQCTAG